jgi:hypothetical protein
VGLPNTTATTQTEVLAAIIEERRKEFTELDTAGSILKERNSQ